MKKNHSSEVLFIKLVLLVVEASMTRVTNTNHTTFVFVLNLNSSGSHISKNLSYQTYKAKLKYYNMKCQFVGNDENIFA